MQMPNSQTLALRGLPKQGNILSEMLSQQCYVSPFAPASIIRCGKSSEKKKKFLQPMSRERANGESFREMFTKTMLTKQCFRSLKTCSCLQTVLANTPTSVQSRSAHSKWLLSGTASRKCVPRIGVFTQRDWLQGYVARQWPCQGGPVLIILHTRGLRTVLFGLWLAYYFDRRADTVSRTVHAHKSHSGYTASYCQPCAHGRHRQ